MYLSSSESLSVLFLWCSDILDFFIRMFLRFWCVALFFIVVFWFFACLFRTICRNLEILVGCAFSKKSFKNFVFDFDSANPCVLSHVALVQVIITSLLFRIRKHVIKKKLLKWCLFDRLLYVEWNIDTDEKGLWFNWTCDFLLLVLYNSVKTICCFFVFLFVYLFEDLIFFHCSCFCFFFFFFLREIFFFF